MTEITFGSKTYQIKNDPIPHIEINALDAKPSISARWNTKSCNPPKACTQDVLHLAPYKNCSVNCAFCSISSPRGYYPLYQKHGLSIVFSNYDTYVEQEIQKAKILHTFDFGADADVFNPLNDHYHMTEKTLRVLDKWGLPFSLTSKRMYSPEAIDLLSRNKNNWAQISIITLDESVRKQIIANGATMDQIRETAQAIKKAKVFLTARIQPFIPLITEDPEIIVPELKELGFDAIVFGMMRAPMGKGKKQFELYDRITASQGKSKVSELFTENYPGYWQTANDYTAMVLGRWQSVAKANKIKFGLCDTYIKNPKTNKMRSLQEVFGTEIACECKNAYAWSRESKEDKFKIIPKCIGNCLYCKENPPCGVSDFPKTVRFTIKNYQKLR